MKKIIINIDCNDYSLYYEIEGKKYFSSLDSLGVFINDIYDLNEVLQAEKQLQENVFIGYEVEIFVV